MAVALLTTGSFIGSAQLSKADSMGVNVISESEFRIRIVGHG